MSPVGLNRAAPASPATSLGPASAASTPLCHSVSSSRLFGQRQGSRVHAVGSGPSGSGPSGSGPSGSPPVPPLPITAQPHPRPDSGDAAAGRHKARMRAAAAAAAFATRLPPIASNSRLSLLGAYITSRDEQEKGSADAGRPRAQSAMLGMAAGHTAYPSSKVTSMDSGAMRAMSLVESVFSSGSGQDVLAQGDPLATSSFNIPLPPSMLPGGGRRRPKRCASACDLGPLLPGSPSVMTISRAVAFASTLRNAPGMASQTLTTAPGMLAVGTSGHHAQMPTSAPVVPLLHAGRALARLGGRPPALQAATSGAAAAASSQGEGGSCGAGRGGTMPPLHGRNASRSMDVASTAMSVPYDARAMAGGGLAGRAHQIMPSGLFLGAAGQGGVMRSPWQPAAPVTLPSFPGEGQTHGSGQRAPSSTGMSPLFRFAVSAAPVTTTATTLATRCVRALAAPGTRLGLDVGGPAAGDIFTAVAARLAVTSEGSEEAAGGAGDIMYLTQGNLMPEMPMAHSEAQADVWPLTAASTAEQLELQPACGDSAPTLTAAAAAARKDPQSAAAAAAAEGPMPTGATYDSLSDIELQPLVDAASSPSPTMSKWYVQQSQHGKPAASAVGGSSAAVDRGSGRDNVPSANGSRRSIQLRGGGSGSGASDEPPLPPPAALVKTANDLEALLPQLLSTVKEDHSAVSSEVADGCLDALAAASEPSAVAAAAATAAATVGAAAAVLAAAVPTDATTTAQLAPAAAPAPHPTSQGPVTVLPSNGNTRSPEARSLIASNSPTTANFDAQAPPPVALVAAQSQHASAMVVGESSGGDNPEECWHEVWATKAVDPVTGQPVLALAQVDPGQSPPNTPMCSSQHALPHTLHPLTHGSLPAPQHDVTAKVVMERHLALVMETEHRLLEQLFPRHILAYITEEWTREALRAAHLATAGSPRAEGSGGRGGSGQLMRPMARDCTALVTWHHQIHVTHSVAQLQDALMGMGSQAEEGNELGLAAELAQGLRSISATDTRSEGARGAGDAGDFL